MRKESSYRSRLPFGSEKGHQVVEAALVMLLMFGLFFLLLDMAVLVFAKSTLQQAVKDGVRFGVTGQTLSGQTYLNDSIVRVVQNSSLGFLQGSSGACKISVNYYNPQTGAPGNDSGGNVLEVSVNNYSVTPLGAILKSAAPLSFSVRSADIMEPCLISGCAKAANPNPPVCP